MVDLFVLNINEKVLVLDDLCVVNRILFDYVDLLFVDFF